MFTGVIEEVGRVAEARKRTGSMTLWVTARTVLEDIRTGDSISIDGACQTVIAHSNTCFAFDTQWETIRKATMGSFVPGRYVNLERSLTPEKRLGGHFVQGHVNGTGLITCIRKKESNVYFTFRLPEDLIPNCIREGSIALDGISLTIAELSESQVTVNVIPYTFAQTTLQYKKVGDKMNIETDLIGRYMGRFLEAGYTLGSREEIGNKEERGLTQDKLRRWGW